MDPGERGVLSEVKTCLNPFANTGQGVAKGCSISMICCVELHSELGTAEERRESATLVFFTGMVLRGPEARYPEIEKKAYVVLCVARRLRLYFQAYKIIVVTNDPLKKFLQSLVVAVRLIL